MTESVLIVGYGRAGKRHARMAKELGLIVDVVELRGLSGEEQYVRDHVPWKSLEMAISGRRCWKGDEGWGGYDYAVICTPPDLHLEQIKMCLDAGLKVLCEKPLCGIGQLEEARSIAEDSPVMVAYNWRYHSEVRRLKKRIARGNVRLVEFDFSQHRADLPEWGLLLDHCSHDLDMFSFISPEAVKIEEAEYSETETGKLWDIGLKNGLIYEHVSSESDDERRAMVRVHYGNKREIVTVNLEPEPEMYLNMWKAFLAGDYYFPGLGEAIKTQELLETCYRLDAQGGQGC